MMIVHVIDSPVVGPPLMLMPDGILLRWPEGERLPSIGSHFSGTVIHLADPEQRQSLADLLTGHIVERSDAACRLPSKVVHRVYCISHANNLRRIGRKISPGLRAHVLDLISDGETVGQRSLLYAVTGRTEAEQLRRWNRTQGSE